MFRLGRLLLGISKTLTGRLLNKKVTKFIAELNHIFVFSNLKISVLTIINVELNEWLNECRQVNKI